MVGAVEKGGFLIFARHGEHRLAQQERAERAAGTNPDAFLEDGGAKSVAAVFSSAIGVKAELMTAARPAVMCFRA